MAIAADITQQCSANYRAGNQEIYVIEACLLTAATASASDHSFTAITSASDWFKVEGEYNTIAWSSEGNFNGSHTVTATLDIEGVEKANGKKLEDIVKANKVAIVVVSNNLAGTNPRAHIIGYDSIQGNQAGLNAKIDAMVEASIVDGGNKYTLSFEGIQLEHPREMVGTIAYNAGTVTFGS